MATPVAATPVTATPAVPSAKTEKKNDVKTFAIEFLMGGVSAAVSKTLAAPIELIKLRLQNMDAMIKAGTLTSTSTTPTTRAGRNTQRS